VPDAGWWPGLWQALFHAISAFNNAVAKVGEIEQVHLIAGNFDYLMKIRTRSMTEYRAVLAEKISTLPHVANTSTYVAMQAVKEDGSLNSLGNLV